MSPGYGALVAEPVVQHCTVTPAHLCLLYSLSRSTSVAIVKVWGSNLSLLTRTDPGLLFSLLVSCVFSVIFFFFLFFVYYFGVGVVRLGCVCLVI